MTEWLARTLANTTLVSCLSLAGVVLYQIDRKQQRDRLSITSAAILFLGACIAWFAIPHYAYGWAAGAILTTFLAAGTYYQASTVQNKNAGRLLQIALGVGLLLSAAVPYWQYKGDTDATLSNAAARANQKSLDSASAYLSRESDSVLNAVKELSKADYFTKAVSENTVAGLGIDLQRFMLENGLSSVTVTNGQGAILIRPNQPGITGSSFYTTSPWAIPAYEGKPVSGLAVDDQGIPSVSAALSFGGTEDSPQYVLLASKSINEDFLQNMKGDLGSGIAITPAEGQRSFVTGDPSERALYQAAALATDTRPAIRDRASHDNFTPLLTPLSLDGVKYVATTLPLHTVPGGGAIAASVLHRDQSTPAWPLYLLLGGALLLALASFWPLVSPYLPQQKKNRSKKNAHSPYLGLALPLLLAFPLVAQSALSALAVPALLGRSIKGDIVTVQGNELGPTAFLTFGRLAGSDQTLALGQSDRLTIRVDNGGANVGEVHAVVYYQPDRITVSSISFESSFCTSSSQQIEGRSGKITINCTAPNPSFSGQIGTLATLNIQTRQPGSALFWFDSHKSTVAGYSSDPRPLLAGTRPTQIEVQGAASDAPSIASPTHPLLQGCQTSATAELHWLKPSATRRFEYAWTELSPTDSPSQNTVSTSLSLPVKQGATHWLSLRAVKDDGTRSAVSHYRIDGCTP